MSNKQFFLGANSAKGFFSYYEDWLDPLKTNRFFIIKGAPGNGKSSFMQRIESAMEKKGYPSERILCSADPHSLDGVYFPAIGVAFADGTAPHVLEPRYPLGVEAYLPLTQCVDDAAISCVRGKVIGHIDELKGIYERLTRVLSAVKSIQDEQHALVFSREAIGKITRRTRGIIRREIRKCDSQNGRKGVLHKRFLSALTDSGETVLWDTVHGMAERVYEIEDNYHYAHVILSVILNAALECGYEVYACYDPMDPQALSHLILPDISAAFVTSGSARPYPGNPYRRIRLDACVPLEVIRAHRLRLRFLQKTERALLGDASGLMENAGEVHDSLEQIYNEHVDFQSLRALADAYAEKILLDWGK